MTIIKTKHLMKKLLYILSMLVLVCACASNEKKADKLINDYMYKHLHDYKSYEPIETKLDTMYNSPITDKGCIDICKEMKDHIEKMSEYDDEAERDHDTMDIWSGGWSSTSRNEYKKAYVSWCKNKRASTIENIAALEGCKKLIKQIEGLDGKTQVGWIADHTFRSNTLGGNSSLGTQAFFIDKDFKNILYTMDDDDSAIYKSMTDLVGLAINFGTVEKVDSVIVAWQGLVEQYTGMIDRAE